MDVHPGALKHAVSAEDMEHAIRHAMAFDALDDDLQLHLGPARDGSLLEIITVARGDDREDMAIHAMAMRPKFQRLLPGEQR